MEAKFEKGQRARVTKKNGKVVEGMIRDWGYNPCTFEREVQPRLHEKRQTMDDDLHSRSKYRSPRIKESLAV